MAGLGQPHRDKGTVMTEDVTTGSVRTPDHEGGSAPQPLWFL